MCSLRAEKILVPKIYFGYDFSALPFRTLVLTIHQNEQNLDIQGKSGKICVSAHCIIFFSEMRANFSKLF